MPLLLRLSQCALEVLGRYVELIGAVDSSGKFHRAVWKHSNTTDAGNPNEGSGLSNRCCQWHRIDPLEVSGCYAEQTGAVESNGNPQGWMKGYSTPTAPLLPVIESPAPTALEGLFSGSSTGVDATVGLGRSIRILWKDRIPCMDKVSFKIKDTFQCARDQFGSIVNHLDLVIFLYV